MSARRRAAGLSVRFRGAVADLLSRVRIAAVRTAYAVGRRRPVRPQVVLATRRRRLSGNLAALRVELDSRRPGVPVVELTRRSRGVRSYLRGLIDEMVAGYLVAHSRVFIVDDSYFALDAVGRRSGTTVVQVWHATGALKKFGRSIDEKSEAGARPNLTGGVRSHSDYDVLLASSAEAAAAFAEAFDQPLDRFVWQLGIPSTDVLFNTSAEEIARYRRQLGISPERKAILYAPTFRGHRGDEARHPGELDLGVLAAQLGSGYVVLERAHPLARRTGGRSWPSGFVIDVSGEPEIEPLLLASDFLVSDYSSVIFDFALLGRPIAIFAPDRDQYEQERGFYFDFPREGPGPVFNSTADLADYIAAGSFDIDRVRKFANRWFAVADGGATHRVVERLIMPALAGQPPRLPRGPANRESYASTGGTGD